MKAKIRTRVAAAALCAIAALVAFERGLWAQEAPSRSVWDGVYTKAQAARGEAVYAQECSECHGPTLTGGEEAPALTGAAFLSNWGGLTVGDLFERVRISMPPNKKGKLTRPQIVEVLTHVLSVNGFPEGKTELDRETEKMRQIRIEINKSKSD